MHASHGSNLIGAVGGAAGLRPRGDVTPRRRTSSARRSTSRPTRRCRWRAAAWSSTTRPTTASSRSTRAPSPRTRSGCSAPGCWGCRNTASGSSCATPAAVSGRRSWSQRDEMCLMLVARKMAVPVKWVEDRRENLLAAGQSRHEHGRPSRWPSTPTASSRRPRSTSCPTAAPTRRPGRSAPPRWSAALFPGPYRVPKASFTAKAMYTNTVGRAAYRGPWQFESLAREMLLDIAARQMGIDPMELRRRNLLRTDELPYTNPNGMHVRQHFAPRDVRAGAGDARLRGLPPGAGRGSTGRSLSRRRRRPPTSSRPRPGFGYYATEAATIRIEPSGKVNVYIAGGSAGNSIETTVVQLTADALGVDIEDVATIQGDTAVTGFGAGAAGSRSGSMTAGAIRETADDPARTDRAPSPPTSWRRPPKTSNWPTAGPAFAGRRRVGISLAEIADDGLLRPHSLFPTACRPGWRPAPGTRADARFDLGERHPPVHLRGRCRHRPGRPAALHRQRGLRAR